LLSEKVTILTAGFAKKNQLAISKVGMRTAYLQPALTVLNAWQKPILYTSRTRKAECSLHLHKPDAAPSIAPFTRF
jgi:hypothetical protein